MDNDFFMLRNHLLTNCDMFSHFSENFQKNNSSVELQTIISIYISMQIIYANFQNITTKNIY